jgi:type VI secretion system protein
MGLERTLLERLADPRADRPLTVNENTELLAESVLKHLQRMLNTRQGHVLVQPEYGMPDVTEFVQTLPEMVNAVQKAIKNSIQKFEPRLRNPTITFVPSEFYQTELRFEITAELVTQKEEASVFFETEVSPSGEIRIKG